MPLRVKITQKEPCDITGSLMCTLSPRSPVDEEDVHHSFNQIIAENSQSVAPSEAFELQQLQWELTEEVEGILVPSCSFKCHSELERCSCRTWERGGYTVFCVTARKREHLVNNLQNLSVSDRVRMLREMPLSVAEKSNLRGLALQKERQTQASGQMHCCSQLKYYTIIAARQGWYSWLSFLHSLQLWQVPLKRVSGRFGTGVLSYFVFIKTLLLFNVFLFLVTGAFLVLPQALFPPDPSADKRSFYGLELLTGAGYFTDSVMYYGYYANYTLQKSCRVDGGHHNTSLTNGTMRGCISNHHHYNMPLAYFFTIGVFIFTLLDTLFGELLWRLFSERVLRRRRRPVFDIARNVLELIYGQTLAWLGVLFTPLLPAVQILKLLLLFYIKKSSVMMNCQAPRKPYRVSQMTTIFITLLCFPSFVGASVCVTYTMWSIKPSSSCGPFRELKTMFQAGKRWVEKLEEGNQNLSVLANAYSYLVEHPFFLFLGAGIFLIVIYFHSQVVDGQRKIISLLQEQIENEGEDKKFLISRLQSIHEQRRGPNRRQRRQVCVQLLQLKQG
uniref:Transmembrane channel-like protein n=1 Tax=Takifugu rubripes TaxID=31033 RepID=H2U400_TAKRU